MEKQLHPPAPPWRGAAIVFAIALSVYALGMARGIATDDSAELQVLGPAMQQLHATGYPLQLLLVRAATALSPLDTPTTVTLLSALAAAIALAFLFAAVAIATGKSPGGYAAALALGLSHSFWMQASLPEVYALHAAFLTGLLLLYAVALRRPGRATRCAMASALLLGVGSGNHLTLALMLAVFGPAYFFTFSSVRRPLCLAACAALFAFGLVTIYAVLAMRFQQLAAAGLLSDDGVTPPARFAIWWALGGPARGAMFSFGLGALVRRLAYFGIYFVYQFPPPLLLIVVASPFVAWRRRPLRPWLLTAMAVGLVMLVHGLNFDSSDIFVFYIPCYIVAAGIVGLAFDRVAQSLEGLIPGDPFFSLPAICATLAIFSYILAPRFLDENGMMLSHDKGNQYYLWPPKSAAFELWNDQAAAIVATVPAGAPLLADWNTLHLLNGYASRLPADERPRLVNLPREGSPLREGNWSSFVYRYLVAHPSERVYTVGSHPLAHADMLFKVHDAGGIGGSCFQIIELSTKPSKGDADFELNRFLFNLLSIRLARGRMPLTPNSVEIRPFYGGNGDTTNIQYNGPAVGEYMRMTGSAFDPPDDLALSPNLPTAATAPPPGATSSVAASPASAAPALFVP